MAAAAGAAGAQGLGAGADARQHAERAVHAGLERAAEIAAQRPATFGPPTASLAGRYAGLMACGPVVLRMQLELNVAPGGMITARLQQRPSETAAGFGVSYPAIDQAVHFGFDPIAGAFAIDVAPTGIGNPGMQLRQRITGLVTAQAATLVGLPAGAGPYSGCSPAVFKRGPELPAEWRHVEEAVASLNPRSSRRPPLGGVLGQLGRMFGGGCDRKMVEWMEQLPAGLTVDPAMPGASLGSGGVVTQWNLFADASFEPFFGKPLHALDGGDRESMFRALNAECPKDARYRDASRLLVGGVLTVLLDAPGSQRVAVHATNLAQAEARRWLQSAQARLQQPFDERLPLDALEDVLRTSEPLLAMLWPRERAEFVVRVREQRTALLMGSFKRRIEAGGGEGAEAMDRLEQLVKAVIEPRLRGARPPRPGEVRAGDLAREQWEELDRLLAVTLARDAPRAAASLAPAMTAPVQADQLRRWSETFPNLRERLTPAAQAAVDETFAQRRRGIASEWAAKELHQAQGVVAGEGAPLSKLKVLMQQERRAGELLTPYLAGDEWTRHQREVAQLRQRLVAQGADQLVPPIQQAANRADIESLIEAHMTAQDLDSFAAAPVKAAVKTRLAVVAPFYELTGGAYFDALYAGDFRTAEQLDSQLSTGYGASMNRMLDGFNRALLGRAAPPARDPFSDALRSLITSPRFNLGAVIASVYLTAYEGGPYRACLGNSHTKIKITTSHYQRVSQRFGSYDRYLGDTTREVRVKNDLAALAMRVNLSDPSFSARLVDFISGRNSLGAADVVEGTRQLMERFGCSDRRVLQLEQRLTEYVTARGHW